MLRNLRYGFMTTFTLVDNVKDMISGLELWHDITLPKVI